MKQIQKVISRQVHLYKYLLSIRFSFCISQIYSHNDRVYSLVSISKSFFKLSLKKIKIISLCHLFNIFS